MKTAQLLQTLNDQLSELAALVAPLAEHATLSPRFDRQLFHTRSTLMQAYLAEAQHNFNQLRQAVERQQLPQVVWIAERLAAQIAALRRETATWSLRSWDHASPTLSAGSAVACSIRSMSAACWRCATNASVSWRRRPALTSSSGWGKKLKPTAAGWRAADRRWTRLKTYWRG